jgi:hypothetical protein
VNERQDASSSGIVSAFFEQEPAQTGGGIPAVIAHHGSGGSHDLERRRSTALRYMKINAGTVAARVALANKDHPTKLADFLLLVLALRWTCLIWLCAAREE